MYFLTDGFLPILFPAHQLSKLETKIQSVADEIVALSKALKLEKNPVQSAFLRTTLTQLRDKENKLLDKKLQLLTGRMGPIEPRPSALVGAIQPIEKAGIAGASGSLPFPGAAKVCFAENVWLEMCQSVQERVMVLVGALEELKKVQALSNMSSNTSVEEANMLGIKVLHSEKGKVLLGAFDLPDIHHKIIGDLPKGSFVHCH